MSLLGATEPRPRIPPLREAATMLNEAVSHRADLVAIELTEARAHALTSAILLGVAVLLAFLGLLTLNLIVAALVWESPHRAWWLVGLGGIHLGGAAIAVLLLQRRLRSWQPLSEIRHQLHLDQQCLSQILKAILP